MRIKITRFLIYILILSAVVINTTSCKKSNDTSSTPVATSKEATLIGQKWATLQGVANAKNQSVEIIFEYDSTATYSLSVKGTPGTLTGNTNTIVTANITGLEPGTEYFYRIKVKSPTETVTGKDTSFTTTNPGKTVITFNPGLAYGSVNDNDDNVYNTITIGTQAWMAENLKTTKFNDGTVIPFLPDMTAWIDSTSSGYCWYNNDSLVYGALYNWYAVNTSKLCPTGWHVPSDTEWSLLTTYIGGESTAGAKLMEEGNVHWQTPNYSQTNETGFTALPGGYRSTAGTYNSIRRYGYWWTSTEYSSAYAYCRSILYSYAYVDRSNTGKEGGFSVRCVKD